MKMYELQQQWMALLKNASRNSAENTGYIQFYQDLWKINQLEILQQVFKNFYQTIGLDQWQDLTDRYFFEYSSRSPLFYKIPDQFIDFLQSLQEKQQYSRSLFEIAHYEWLQFLVSVFPHVPIEQTSAWKKKSLRESYFEMVAPQVIYRYQYPIHSFLSRSIEKRSIVQLVPKENYVLFRRDPNNQLQTFSLTEQSAQFILNMTNYPELVLEAQIDLLAENLNIARNAMLEQQVQQLLEYLLEQQIVMLNPEQRI